MPPTHEHVTHDDHHWTVYPTGTYPTDKDSAEWALQQASPGDTILLKARNEAGEPDFFHFGDDVTGRGSINVQKDITIVGEPLLPAHAFTFPNTEQPLPADAPDRTVVYGGERPFRCAHDNPDATALTVRHLFFAYPKLAAVQVAKSSGLEVSECIVHDIESGMTTKGFLAAVGIEATGLAFNDPQALHGNFNVSHNIVKRREDLAYQRADSGIVLQLADMTAQIHHNTVSHFAFVGIAIDANGRDVTVSENTISLCGYGDKAGQGFAQACGIGVRRMSAPARATVKKNTIVAGEIDGLAGTSLMSKNGISVCGASDVEVQDNTVTGIVSSSGILVTKFVAQSKAETFSTRNEIMNNDLKGLVARHAQVLVDQGCDANRLTHNELGAVDLSLGVAGLVVHASDNRIANQTFWGNYPGTSGTPAMPCVWLAVGTSGNRVTALKHRPGPPAFDLCSQVQDDGASNEIPGYERCTRANLPQIVDRERLHCVQGGGTWSEATQSCAFPA